VTGGGPAMSETGERQAFLGRLRDRLAGGIPGNVAHPAPPPLAAVPAIGYRTVDRADLVGSFVDNAAAVGAVVHRVEGPAPDAHLLADLVERHGVVRAVVSAEPEAVATGEALAALGVLVEASTPAAAERADLGVTSADALVAATGSVSLRSDHTGSRTVSLLPRIHLCVAPADRIVASTADVLRVLAGHDDLLPSNLVLVTGPSRTGDIEQILTKGVHGPVAVHVVLTGAGPADV